MIEYSIKLLLGSLLFLVPLYFDLNIADTFGVGKVTILHLFSVWILSLWLAKAVYYEKIEFKRTPLDIPILIFLIINSASAICSTSIAQSIFGGYNSQEGLITILCYILLFFATTNLSEGEIERWYVRLGISFLLSNILILFFPQRATFSIEWAYQDRIGLFFLLFYTASFYLILSSLQTLALSNIFIMVSVIAGVYMLLQSVGYDFISWEKSKNATWTTFGNEGFFSAYSLIPLFISASAFLGLSKEREKVKGLLYLLITALIAYCVFWVRARSNLVGFFAGGLCFLSLLGFRGIKERKKQIGLLVAIFASSVIYCGFTSENALFIRTAKEMKKMKREEALQPEPHFSTMALRFNIWRACLSIIKERPILGIGQDTLMSVYPKYRTLSHTKTEGQYSRTRRAHNDLIHIATTTGILGLISYIYLHTLFSIVLYKAICSIKGTKRFFLIGILSAWTAYHINDLFSFGIPPINSMFWVLLGIGVAVAVKPKIYRKRLRLGVMRWPILGLIIAFAILGTKWVIDIYRADILFKRARALERVGRLKEAIPVYKEAIRLDPWHKDRYDGLLNTYLTLSRVRPDPEYTKEAVFWAEKAVKLFSQDSICWNFLGGAYYLDGVATGRDRSREAVEAYKKAILCEPYLVDAHTNIGQILFAQDRVDEAYTYFSKVLSFYPKEPRSLYYVGYIAFQKADYEKAREHLQLFLRLHPDHYKAESARAILVEIKRR
jgi:O-antigen ligase/Flp pilus assembly protein TadD